MSREHVMERFDAQAAALWQIHPVVWDDYLQKMRPQLWEMLSTDEQRCAQLVAASDAEIQALLTEYYATIHAGQSAATHPLKSLKAQRNTVALGNQPTKPKMHKVIVISLAVVALLVALVAYAVIEQPDWISSLVKSSSKTKTKGHTAAASSAQQKGAKGAPVVLTPKERVDALEVKVQEIANEHNDAKANPWSVYAFRAKHIAAETTRKLDGEIQALNQEFDNNYTTEVNRLKKEIADLSSSINRRIKRIEEECVCPFITGELSDRIGDDFVQVFGQCIWRGEALGGPFRGKGNIIVVNPKKGGVIAGNIFQSQGHYYLGQTTGENVFGVEVGVYIYDSVEAKMDREVGPDLSRLAGLKDELQNSPYLADMHRAYARGTKLSNQLIFMMIAGAGSRVPTKELFEELQPYAQIPTEATSREQYKKLVEACSKSKVGYDGVTLKFDYPKLTGDSATGAEYYLSSPKVFAIQERNFALSFRFYKQFLHSAWHVVEPKTMYAYSDEAQLSKSLQDMLKSSKDANGASGETFPVDLPLHTHIAASAIEAAGWHLAGPYNPAGTYPELTWYAISPIVSGGVPADQTNAMTRLGDLAMINKTTSQFFYL